MNKEVEERMQKINTLITDKVKKDEITELEYYKKRTEMFQQRNKEYAEMYIMITAKVLEEALEKKDSDNGKILIPQSHMPLHYTINYNDFSSNINITIKLSKRAHKKVINDEYYDNHRINEILESYGLSIDKDYGYIEIGEVEDLVPKHIGKIYISINKQVLSEQANILSQQNTKKRIYEISEKSKNQ